MPSAGGIAQRRAEAEGEPHHELRPPCDPLGQRIQRHQQQRRHAQRLRQTVELQQDRQPHQQQHGQEHQRMPRAQHAGGQRPARRARHHAVDIAIPEVVHHASGSPHHQAADPEQHDQPYRLGRATGRRAECPTAPAGTAARCRSADRPGRAEDRAARSAAAGPPSRSRRCRYAPAWLLICAAA